MSDTRTRFVAKIDDANAAVESFTVEATQGAQQSLDRLSMKVVEDLAAGANAASTEHKLDVGFRAGAIPVVTRVSPAAAAASSLACQLVDGGPV